MYYSGRRSHLTAFLNAMLTCLCLLSLSSLLSWAKAGTITEFPVPSGSPEFITAGPDGNLWFTLSFGNSIGRITTK